MRTRLAARRTLRKGAGFLFLGLVALAGQAPALVSGTAASPSSGTLTAPVTPGTTQLTWHGTIPPGADTANGNLRCHDAILAVPASPGLDDFHLQLAGVGAAYYVTHSALLTIRIDWTPSTNDSLNRLQMTTVYDDGSG